MSRMKTIHVEIAGVSPIIFHSSRLANPLDPIKKAISQITAKPSKKRTDSDIEEMQRLEFIGGMVTDDAELSIAPRGRVVVPGEYIEGTIVKSAKSKRQGGDYLAGVYCDGAFPLIYDGPKDPDGLWKKRSQFCDARMAVVQKARILRVRPIFRTWSVAFTLSVETSMVSANALRETLEYAGRFIGIGDFRPKFGRFDIVKFEEA